MHKHSRYWLGFILISFQIFLLHGCKVITYTSNKDTLTEITRPKARLIFEGAVKKMFINSNHPPCLMGGDYYLKFSSIKWHSNDVKLVFVARATNETFEYNLQLANLEIPNRINDTGKGCYGYEIIIKSVSSKELYFLEPSLDNIKELIDALCVLKYKDYKSESDQEIEKFKTTAEQYYILKVKPSLPEEARKYIVQATSATEEKRYDDAIDLYDKAILIDKTYPQAHFNKALLLSQIEQYYEAITEMKKYLMLVPDAADARAAQDKIYEWEEKVGK